MPRTDGSMLKPVTSPLDDVRPRLKALARQSPEWRLWLTLLEETLRELNDSVWTVVVPQLTSDQPTAAPLLHQAELPVNGHRVRDWVQRLMKTAATDERPEATSLAIADLSRMDVLALLEAAVCQD